MRGELTFDDLARVEKMRSPKKALKEIYDLAYDHIDNRQSQSERVAWLMFLTAYHNLCFI